LLKGLVQNATPDILTTVSEVNDITHEQFEREGRYRVAMPIARTMLQDGLISKKEYRTIDTIFIEKYMLLSEEL